MLPFLFYLFTTLVSANLDCPSLPFGHGTSGQYPSNNDTHFDAGFNCNFMFSIPEGLYAKVYIFSNLWGSSDLTVSDGYGTVFDNTLSYGALYTAVGLQIRINSSTPGTLSIQWLFESLNTENQKETTVVAGLATIVSPPTTVFSTVKIRATAPIVIYGDYNTSYEIFFLGQKSFIFAGEGWNGTYLGSLYSLKTSGKPIVIDKSPFTVTIFSNDDILYGGFLIRQLSDIEGIDYSFQWTNFTETEEVTLRSSDKPSVITILDSTDPPQYFYVTSTKFQYVYTSFDWQPSSTLPPSSPILSFDCDNRIATVPLDVPGITKTFVAKNGNVTFTYAKTIVPPYPVLELGDYGYFSSLNYQTATISQRNSITFAVNSSLAVQFTPLYSYSNFKVLARNGTQVKGPYKLSNGSQILTGPSFTLIYDGTSLKDTGGLLRFDAVEVPAPVDNGYEKYNSLFVLIFVMLHFLTREP